MADDPQQVMRDFEPTCEYFVGIDSDGCAFDTMEPKQKEVFCPTTIWKWDLMAASKYAREVWLFVNLYSKTRGCNRFLALDHAMDFIRERPEVQRRGVAVPAMTELKAWIARETKLGNPALEAEVERTGNDELARCLDWSATINETVAKVVKGIPPYPGVRESLELLSGKADMIVVSATPCEALEREWNEHGIADHMAIIAGQELGKKAEHPATSRPPRRTTPCSTPSIPGMKRSRGRASSRKRGRSSSRASTPARTRPSVSPSSTNSCPNSRRGKRRLWRAAAGARPLM